MCVKKLVDGGKKNFGHRGALDVWGIYIIMFGVFQKNLSIIVTIKFYI